MNVPEAMRMEFASPAWLDFLGKLLVARAAIGATPDGVTCEVYRDVPHHLSAAGRLAWTRRVRGQNTEFVLDECPDDEADIKLVGAYAAMLPLASAVVGDDPTAFETMFARALEAGDVTIVREHRDDAQPRDFTVHDLMAVLTR